MDAFFSKLEQLAKAMAQFNASIKQPKMPGVKVPKPRTPKLPGNPAKSKKDPVKVAEQIKNADQKPMAMDAAKMHKEALKVSKNGQWKLS